MKKKHTAQSAFFRQCISFGLVIFFAGVLLALFAAPAAGRLHHAKLNSPESSHAAGIVIGGDGAEGGPCQYAVTYRTDPIVPGNTDTHNHCAWCDTMINLPFPFVLYNQTFNAVMVNSSGRLDFVCNNEPSGYTETCLPAPPNNCPYDYTIFALWGEWSTITSAPGCATWPNGCGIFTSVSGTAPNRILNIEWHAVRRENGALRANFEVRLYENHPNNGDTIHFDPMLNGRNIELRTSELVIDKHLTINGPGSNLVGVYRSSNTSFRIMHVMPGVTATIAGLTISNGDAGQQDGGGILNDHATLTIQSCVVQNNFGEDAGGVYNDGSGGSST